MIPLSSLIKNHIDTDYPLHSRIHPLKIFNISGLECFVKRDDELGLMGSKIRKYSSLMTHIQRKNITQALIIGGINSNHVLGISQLLIENAVHPILFICESHQTSFKGNALLTTLLISDPQIHWIPRNQWKQVQQIVQAYHQSYPRSFIVPEGGCMPEAFPGALTLAYDIRMNEEKLGSSFDHIFVDSGTGLTAIALILGLSFLKHPAHIHVVLMAGQEHEFHKLLKFYYEYFQSILGYTFPFPRKFSLQKPAHAKAFGSTTTRTFAFIQQLAREEGILCDPIYNAKLFSEAKTKINKERLQGKALIIQSGGTLSLLGFLNA